MAYAKTEEEWGQLAADHLKAKMKEAGVTYDEMVKRLKKHGFKDESVPKNHHEVEAGCLFRCLFARLSGSFGS